MGSFKGHALPGSFFLVAGIWWTAKHSLWYATRRNKNIGSTRLASRASQRRLEIIENSVVVFFSFMGASCHSVLNLQNISRKRQKLEEQFRWLIFNSCTRLYVKATNWR